MNRNDVDQPPTSAAPGGVQAQPISTVQWVPRTRLSANSWNPNKQFSPEFKLLALSILENGWTAPIVVRAHDGGERLEIVDGYHRWCTSENPLVYALTDGLLPVVVLPETDEILARLATVRHNRARGTHGVLPMADIVSDLSELGLSPEDIGRRLGMDEEEVDRLLDRGNMLKRGAAAAFGNGWGIVASDSEGTS